MKPTYEEIEQQLSESRREFRAADATIHNLELKLTGMAAQLNNAESKCAAPAAENEVLKSCVDGWCDMPATDACLAEVRAQARDEGINYAASRLTAAYNHGFIGKSMSEIADIMHMILDAKTDLANDPMPAADGLSGEYAEKSLVEFAAQLRQGDEQ